MFPVLDTIYTIKNIGIEHNKDKQKKSRKTPYNKKNNKCLRETITRPLTN